MRPNTAAPLSAFDHLTLAIRNYHNSGNTTTIRIPLAEPAATVAGFALSPFSASAVPEITTPITHLRDVLGEPDLRIARPQG